MNLTNWLGALCASALLLAVQQLDAPATEAQDMADEAAFARTMAQYQADLENAARLLCRIESGPEFVASWTADGDLVCIRAGARP